MKDVYFSIDNMFIAEGLPDELVDDEEKLTEHLIRIATEYVKEANRGNWLNIHVDEVVEGKE